MFKKSCGNSANSSRRTNSSKFCFVKTFDDVLHQNLHLVYLFRKYFICFYNVVYFASFYGFKQQFVKIYAIITSPPLRAF